MKKWLFSFTIAIIICFFTLPTILSTSWGVKKLSKKLSSNNQNISIENLSLSWFGDQRMDGFKSKGPDLNISVSKTTLETPLWKLLFNYQKLGKVTLDQPVIEYQYSDVKKNRENPLIPISTSLTITKGKITIHPKGSPGPIVNFDNIDLDLTRSNLRFRADAIEGKQRGIINIFGTFSFPNTAKIEGNIENFPSKFLHILPKMGDLPELILGDRFDSNISYRLTNRSGDVRFFLSSPLSKINLDAKITNDILELNQLFEAEISITPKLSKTIFQTTSFQPVSSKGPIKLRINKDGSFIPIKNFSLDKIEIPNAWISLGQTIFLNAESLSKILGFIQLQIRQNDHVPIWFQDAPLQLSKGILYIDRTELLIDGRYEIATWGNVDFKPKEPRAKMYVGITKQALEQAFHISNLPDSYLLLLPVDGPLSNLKIHKSKAAKTLAILIGKEQLPIKGLLPPDLFTDNSITIPAARKPFPWK